MQVTNNPSVAPLTGISSMATRQLLAELTQAYAKRSGQTSQRTALCRLGDEVHTYQYQTAQQGSNKSH